jgi:hypothetical protein
MEWKPNSELTPAATVYGDGLNPKQLEDLIFNPDGSFSRKMIGLTGAKDKDITRIVFALSGDRNNVKPYQSALGQFFLKIDRELCDTLAGMKAGFALSLATRKPWRLWTITAKSSSWLATAKAARLNSGSRATLNTRPQKIPKAGIRSRRWRCSTKAESPFDFRQISGLRFGLMDT